MTATRAHSAPSRDGALPGAKAEARKAYAVAKGAGGLATRMADAIWSDTLLSVENQRPGTRDEMFERTASLFTLLADRATWPR